MATVLRVATAHPKPEAWECPLFLCPVPAGLPFPAEHFMEGTLDLNQYLVQSPQQTFFVRVSGDSMLNAGIHPGDLLVVDSAQAPREGMIIIASLNGELTVKRLATFGGKVWLFPENELYQPIELSENMEFRIWGVVRHVIHSF